MKARLFNGRWVGVAGSMLVFFMLLAACSPGAGQYSTVAPTSAPASASNPTVAPTSAPIINASPTAAPTSAPAAAASPTAASGSVPVTGAAIQAADNPKFGKILVNSSGMTLYTFAIDTPTESKCTASDCVQFWPPLTAEGQPAAGAGVTGAVATIARPDGSKQVTYDGKPLYTFKLDQKPGDATGDGINNFGGVWHVVTLGAPPSSSNNSGGSSSGNTGGNGGSDGGYTYPSYGGSY